MRLTVCGGGMTAGAVTVALLAAVLGVASANMYEDMLVEDLYKRLSQMEDSPYDQAGDQAYYNMDDDNIPLDSREAGMAYIRDQEHIEDGASKGGFQYISGGAGEGVQHLTPEGTQNNTQEVKSDESLPFYCHPPNPCPKGFTEKDGCQLDIQDTADAQKNWIAESMKSGRCSCDEEHMFNCPSKQGGGGLGGGLGGAGDKLDQVLSSLLSKGELREPAKRSKVYVPRPPNPYLQGHKVHTVAKKG